MASIKSTPRTKNAIRKADRLPRDLIPPTKQRPSIQGPQLSAGDTYRGPFKAVIKDDTTVTIKAKDDIDYFCENRITAGLESIIISSDQNVTISASGYVYANISYSSVYSCSFAFASSFPAQANGNYYLPIAKVEFSGGAIIDLIQIQFGEIHVNGRIV